MTTRREFVIVLPTHPEDAMRLLQQWFADHPEIHRRLQDDGEVIVDHIRSEHGKTKHRYRAMLTEDEIASLTRNRSEP